MKFLKVVFTLSFILHYFLVVGQNVFMPQVKLCSFDVLGNMYMVQKNNQIVKYDSKGNLLYSYTNAASQSITAMDCNNPLQTIVFFKDLGKIQYLDKNLAELASAIELFNLNFDDVAMICSSYNNGLWMYENSEKKLCRLNSELEITNTSTRLDQLIHTGFEIHKMIEVADQLLVMDTMYGIYLFDIYGAYKKPLYIGKVTDFQVIGDKIYISNAVEILATNFLAFSSEPIFKSPDPIQKFYISQDFYWILNENQELIKFVRQ